MRARHSEATGQTRHLGARRADQGAQFHERLIEHAGPLVGDQALGGLPEALLRRGRFQILAPGQPARQHALGVGLDDRRGAIEGEGEDCPRDVPADPRQGPDRLRVVGEGPAVLPDDLTGRRVEVACPAVIAQPLPHLEDLDLVRLGQRRDRREPRDEPREEWDHRRDRRLHQHHLRHQHAVGIAVRPPGQGAMRLRIPVDEPPTDPRHPLGIEIGASRSPLGQRSRAGAHHRIVVPPHPAAAPVCGSLRPRRARQVARNYDTMPEKSTIFSRAKLTIP